MNQRGGTPYHYKTRERTYFFKHVEDKNNLIDLSIGWQLSAASLNSTIFNGLFYEKYNEIWRAWSIVSCTCFIVS